MTTAGQPSLKLKKKPQTNDEMIEYLQMHRSWFREDLGVELDEVRLETIFNAMKQIDRREFLPASSRKDAYCNWPISIGYEQTCSQPFTVAFMAYLMEFKEGDCVLEIGTGSGYSAAITALLIGENGRLTTIERISELADFAYHNLKPFPNLERRIGFVTGDGAYGRHSQTPYNKIYCTAAAPVGFSVEPLLEQLTENGLLLLPQKRRKHLNISTIKFDEQGQVQLIPELSPPEVEVGELVLYRKTSPREEKCFAGFGFVPLVTNK